MSLAARIPHYVLELRIQTRDNTNMKYTIPPKDRPLQEVADQWISLPNAIFADVSIEVNDVTVPEASVERPTPAPSST